MKVQAINNNDTNFGHRASKVHYTPKYYLHGKTYNSMAEYDAVLKRENKVMLGSAGIGIAKFIGGACSFLFAPITSTVLMLSGAVIALGGMIFSDKIAESLNNKGILK